MRLGELLILGLGDLVPAAQQSLMTVFIIQVLGEQEQCQAWQWQWYHVVSCGIIDFQPSLSIEGEYDASWDPGVVHKKMSMPHVFLTFTLSDTLVAIRKKQFWYT